MDQDRAKDPEAQRAGATLGRELQPTPEEARTDHKTKRGQDTEQGTPGGGHGKDLTAQAAEAMGKDLGPA